MSYQPQFVVLAFGEYQTAQSVNFNPNKDIIFAKKTLYARLCQARGSGAETKENVVRL